MCLCKSNQVSIGLSDLEQSCTQVADDEGGCHGSVASLQEVDGVQEEEVTWHYQGDQDSGCFGVHIWVNTKQEVVFSASFNLKNK